MSGFYYIESEVHTQSGEPLYLTFVADEKAVSVSANDRGERQQWLLNDYPASPLTAIIPVMDPSLQTSLKEIESLDYVATIPKNNYVWNLQSTTDGYVYISDNKNTVYWTLASGGHNSTVFLEILTKDEKQRWKIVKPSPKVSNTEYDA